MSQRRRHQRSFAELYSLDDRSLADIGITRADIPYVLYGRPRTKRRSCPRIAPPQHGG
ncbi:MAG: DUF1127 domain-containing protein [Alphaproteobacteria bacterium]|nr:DUF1127 domain-containing protein [Alphaproteobacteria bacterium]